MDNREFNRTVAKLMHKSCRGCSVCNGYGCRGEVPGMGGKGQALTFINNFKSWNEIEVDISGVDLPLLGIAPMTGVGQNMGNVYPESVFHNYMVSGAKKAGIMPCIGDGTPDFKLQSGIKALKDNNITGTAFIKPYPNNIILERFKMVEPYVDIMGVDIDSYRIPTMEGLVSLEQKSEEQLLELKEACNKRFIVKGIQSQNDLELMIKVKPDIVVVSNHGGRVFDNGEGIAYRFKELIPELKKIANEVWVDGGLRTISHLKKAKALGAYRVLIGRPLIKATAVFKEDGVPYWLKQLK
ncbi:alpha-hydroxy-acid oxidizing protein [Thiospirochaeta perfilievii]|nr:alpha-hydroxy-acid oxidizing protein [Thiospirochaeta perfilievii]